MLQVRDIMTKHVATVSPDSSLRDTLELLATRHISGAPVVVGSRVVGVITASDLLSFIAANVASLDQPDAEPVEALAGPPTMREEAEAGNIPASAYFANLWDELARGAESASQSVACGLLQEAQVGDVMTRSVVALPPDASVMTAARIMRCRGIHRIMVMQGTRLLGIVTMSDIARAVADRRLM